MQRSGFKLGSAAWETNTLTTRQKSFINGLKTQNLEYAHRIRCFYGAKKSPLEMSGPFVGKIKYGI